jgi:PAS domain S-box-containing protein
MQKNTVSKPVADSPEGLIDNAAHKQTEEVLLKAGALQSAIFNSANFSSIATDAKGVIQIFNVGAERMLGYAAFEVMNKITPADISDPHELIARAKALSAELGTTITPGFEALVFKASRGIEDIYELSYIRKDGSHFPAVVSVTALRDDQDTIIGYLLIGTDNTARKQAEEALQKAGALQSAIFNSANFSSIATDAKGVIQIFNVGAERMLGYAAVEVVNKITPADISVPHEVIARAKALSAELNTTITPGFEALVFKASRGIEDIYELSYIRKDGSHFPAVVSVTALRDGQGAIIGYLLIGTDNTARKLIEADTKQLSQRLRDYQFYTRSLFESNIDALMTSDADGIITDVNKQMEALTDCTRDELIGAPFKKYFTDPEKAEAGINQALNERKITNYELVARARNGRETPVSYNAVTLYDRDRKLQGVFAAARDITEHKQAEQALRESESRFRFMLENSPIAVRITNIASGQIVFANQSYAKLIDASPDQVIGINPIPYYANAQDYVEVQKLLGKGETAVNRLIELRVHSDHSESKWALASFLLLSFQNEPAIMGWFYDISERKQLEDEILHSNTELEQFSYSISHDMRQPLRMISSYLKLLSNSLAEKLDAEQLEYINFAVDGAQRMDAMMLGLLEYSRVGHKGEPRNWVESRTLLDQALQFLQPAISEAEVSIEGDWPRVFVSPDEMLRLLQNLIGNALKFRVAGRKPEVIVKSAIGVREWRVSVADNGIGILPDQIGRLFQVFQRLQSQSAFEGTGIGLALCRKIIGHHGGKIWAESEGAGHGSRFIIELPLMPLPLIA